MSILTTISLQYLTFVQRIARDEAYKLIMHTHWQTFLKTKVGQLIKFESDRNPRVSLAW